MNRVTFLVTGVDSGHDRTHALTDTLLVVSVDKDTNQAVMLSIPRDTARFPMYSGGIYNDKINSLMTAARNNPSKYPDGPTGTLTKEIGYLVGIPINYYAAINLEGFQSMVDLVGGVDIVNPKPITDPVYDWFNGTYGFYLTAGKHHLDGKTALAYARSRYGAGDNDFTRAARQQQLLLALRAKMGTTTMLTKLPVDPPGRREDDPDELPARPDPRLPHPGQEGRRHGHPAATSSARRTRCIRRPTRPGDLHPAAPVRQRSQPCRSSCSARTAATTSPARAGAPATTRRRRHEHRPPPSRGPSP